MDTKSSRSAELNKNSLSHRQILSDLKMPLNLLLLLTALLCVYSHDFLAAGILVVLIFVNTAISTKLQLGDNPLRKELKRTRKLTILAAIVLSAVSLAIGAALGSLSISQIAFYAAAIIIAALPLGIAIELYSWLSDAAKKLTNSNSRHKNLSAITTLGLSGKILTDEVDLAENRAKVRHILIGKKLHFAADRTDGKDIDIQNSEGVTTSRYRLKAQTMFFAAGALTRGVGNDPSYCSGAITALVEKSGMNPGKLESQYPEIESLAPGAGRKYASSIRRSKEDGKLYLFTKGKPEDVLNLCNYILEAGQIKPMTVEHRKSIQKTIAKTKSQSTNSIAFSYRVFPTVGDPKKFNFDTFEQNLVWLGAVTFNTPLQDEILAFQAAERMNLKVSLMFASPTGLAKAKAVKAGFAKSQKDVIAVTCKVLEKMPDQHVLKLIEHGNVVFTNIHPKQKSRLAELAWQHGCTVALASGKTLGGAVISAAAGDGSTAVRRPQGMISHSGSFHSLLSAVKQSRAAITNAKKGIFDNLVTSCALVAVMLASLAATTAYDIPSALSVSEILLIGLLAGVLPIVATGKDASGPQAEPKNPLSGADRHILGKKSFVSLIWSGLLIGGLAFLNYLLFFARNNITGDNLAGGSPIHHQAATLAVLVVILCQLGNIIEHRSPSGLFTKYQLHNRRFWLASGLSIAFLVIIMYTPGLSALFGAGPLGIIGWLSALASAGVLVMAKEFERHSQKHGRKSLIKNHGHQKIRRHLELLRT